MRQLRQTGIVVFNQRDIVRFFQIDELKNALRHMVNALHTFLPRMLRAEKAINQRPQAIGLFDNHLCVFLQCRVRQRAG